MQVVKLEYNCIILAHNKFLSVYDIIRNKWLKHIEVLGGDVRDFFKLLVNDQVHLGVILSNGDIYVVETESLKTIH